jgi:Na+/melibiose symporter-like transporter
MKNEKEIKEILPLYALGTFGVQAIFGLIASFQAEFWNKMYAGLDSNILIGCAVVLFISKLLSSLLDPVIGVWIDRSGANLFRLVRRSIFPLAFLSVLLFLYIPFDRFGGRWVMYAYITVVSVLWSIAMSFAEIPMQSIISYLSKNEAGCQKLAAVTNFAKNMGQGAPPVLVTVIMLLVDMLRGAGNTSDAAYYIINAASVTVLGVLFMVLLTGAKSVGAMSTSAKAKETTSLKTMLLKLRENRNVRVVFFINILGFARAMSNSILLQANGAFIGKVELFGNTFDTTTNATWIPYLFGNITATAAMFIIPIINKRLKEKKTYILFSVLDFIFSMAAYIFYISQPADSAVRYGNGAMYMIMTFSTIGSFLMGVNQFIPLSMTAIIAHHESKKNETEYESAPYAVLTMSVKLGIALSAVVGLMIVGFSGYNQTVYQSAAITPQMQNTVMLAFMALPGISTLLSAVPAFFFDFTYENE